ncbi:MAG: hypothetical protein ACOZEN_07205 [Thermodesulfobacteriota bacterium]
MGSEVFQEEELLSGKDIESAEEVMKRWNETNPDFCHRLRQYEFTVFFCPKQPRKSPDGETIYLGTRGTANCLHYQYDDDWGDLDGVYLLRSEVRAHEEKNPYLAYPVVTDDGCNNKQEQCEDSQSIFLDADDLCKRWGVSPARLVGLIQGNDSSEFPVYWRHKDVDFPF